MNSIARRLIILTLFTLSIACKKKDSPAPPPKKQEPVDTVKSPPINEKLLIPIKVESDNGTINFSYLQETGNLTQIEQADGTTESYTYNVDNHLKQYNRYL